MATKKAIIKSFGAIKTIYPYFGKDADLELLVDTWTALLQNYSDEEVDKGVFLALRVCKFAPVPADVIEQIENTRNVIKPSESELWSHYQRALREVRYFVNRLSYNYIDETGLTQGEQARQEIEKIWNSLPQELKIYVGDKQELMSLARESNYVDMSYERTRFNKTLPVLQKRVEDKALFLGISSYLIEMKNNS